MDNWHRFFQIAHDNLMSDQQLLNYLYGRGVSIESINTFNLGKIPNDHTLFSMFDTEWLEDVGILYSKRTSNGPQSSFHRHPILFPYKNVYGEYIGLAGRTLIPDHKPKYYNNSFVKKYNLYGLDVAKDYIRSDGVYVVEGYMDVIAAHTHGIKNVVAVCSANLSDGHIMLLSRYTRNIVRILDRDRAGIQSHKKWKKPIYSHINISAYVFRNSAIKDVDEYFNKFSGTKDMFQNDLIEFDSIISPNLL